MPVSKCWVIVSDFLLHLRRPLFTSWDALMWLSLPTANRQAFLVSLERMCVSLGDPETLPVLVYRGLQHTKVPSSRSFVFPVFPMETPTETNVVPTLPPFQEEAAEAAVKAAATAVQQQALPTDAWM